MARISVSMSDELVARLEPVKDRINVSQVCREALERRISSFERASSDQEGDPDVGDLVERLREERALLEGMLESRARRNAASWLSTTSYVELKSVTENGNSVDMGKYRLPRGAFKTMKQDLLEPEKLELDGVHAVAYKTAWLDYVKALWAQVLEQVEEPTNHREPVEVPQ